jgi:hypothetical protein
MEDTMKFVTPFLLACVAFAAPASAANMCISTRDIVSSDSKDGKTLVIKMRDGRTLVNHLQGSCPDLKFGGYAWKLQSGDYRVCEHEQSLTTLLSHQTCVLGKFDAPMDKQARN